MSADPTPALTGGHDPELCVIVCTHNRSDVLERCLGSLQRQSLGAERFEVVLVDNRSVDATSEVIADHLARMTNLRAIGEGAVGLSRARNAGLAVTRARYVAFLDDDAEAVPGWCESLLRAFREVAPAPMAVGGPVLARFEAPPPSWFPPAMDDYWRGERGHFVDRFDVFWGGNVAYRREAVRDAGGFDVALGLRGTRLVTGEDTALGVRLYEQAPYFWYEPEAIVHHLSRPSRMTLGYRLRRSFAEGRAWARIHDARYLSMRTLRSLARRLGILSPARQHAEPPAVTRARAEPAPATAGAPPATAMEPSCAGAWTVAAERARALLTPRQRLFQGLYRAAGAAGQLLATRWI
jgi:glycosyltransferase involved in cell wall biosynthesis